jgi:hypothetical protein
LFVFLQVFVSNTEAALEKFCEQIKNGVAQSQIPIIKVVNHYCEGKWKEFKKKIKSRTSLTERSAKCDALDISLHQFNKTISLFDKL